MCHVKNIILYYFTLFGMKVKNYFSSIIFQPGLVIQIRLCFYIVIFILACVDMFLSSIVTLLLCLLNMGQYVLIAVVGGQPVQPVGQGRIVSANIGQQFVNPVAVDFGHGFL